MSDPAYQHPTNLTEEQKKALVVGQCNYLSLMIISLAATICGSNAAWFCNFANREIEFVPDFSLSDACAEYNFTDFQEQWCNSFLDEHGVGFYNWYATVPVDTQTCVSYTLFVPSRGWVTPNFDSAFEAGRVFAVMANFFGLFGFLSVIFASCCPVSQERIKGLSCYFLLATIFQSLTFLLHSSSICDAGFIAQYIPEWDQSNVDSVKCTLGAGGKQAIAATVLYFVASVLAPVSVAPAPIGYSGRQGGDPNFEHPDAAAAAENNA